MLALQLQILAAWTAVKDRLVEMAHDARSEERGELTGSPIRSLDPFWSRVAVCQIESREASTTNQWFSPGSPSRI